MRKRTYWLQIKNIKMKVRFRFTIALGRKDVKSSNSSMVWIGIVQYHKMAMTRLY